MIGTTEDTKTIKALADLVTALENLYPKLEKIQSKGVDYPGYRSVAIETHNIAYVLMKLTGNMY